MISYIEGRLAEKNPTNIILDVGGVGYGINISLTSFQKIGDIGSVVKLLTYLHVREDILQLYGFVSKEEKELFMLLISISGIGPKLAQGILSGMSPNELRQAILKSDLEALTSIPGVGKKTAQRLFVELGEKLGRLEKSEDKLILEDFASLNASQIGIVEESILALVSLGYKRSMASEAVKKVIKESSEELTLENLIKRALRHTM
jgi:Holliday junction DNA helicase RuvA